MCRGEWFDYTADWEPRQIFPDSLPVPMHVCPMERLGDQIYSKGNDQAADQAVDPDGRARAGHRGHLPGSTARLWIVGWSSADAAYAEEQCVKCGAGGHSRAAVGAEPSAVRLDLDARLETFFHGHSFIRDVW